MRFLRLKTWAMFDLDCKNTANTFHPYGALFSYITIPL